MATTAEAAAEYEKDVNLTMLQMANMGCPYKNMGSCPDECKYLVTTNKGLKVCLLFLCTKFVVNRQQNVLAMAKAEEIEI